MRAEMPLLFVFCVQVAGVAGMLRPKEIKKGEVEAEERRGTRSDAAESETLARHHDHVALPSKDPVFMPTYLYNARHNIARLRYSVRTGRRRVSFS